MTRYPGRDEHGRPIVAELGRAETPWETADRKAAASAERRSGMNALNLVIAVAASLGVAMLLVMVVVRPDAQPQYHYAIDDYAAVTADAAEQRGVGYVAPAVPEDWFVNTAEFGTDPGVDSWRLVFITGDQHRLEVIQSTEANPTWLAQVTETGTVSTVIDDSELTVVIVGTASDDELGVLSDALMEELNA